MSASAISISTGASSIAALVVLAAGTAVAAPGPSAAPSREQRATGDAIPPPPPTYQGNQVTVEEKLGARLPLDVVFQTQDGATVRLADALAGELPTILTFNYSACPMLCNQQLTGLTSALPAIAAPTGGDGQGAAAMRLGAQYRIVTISLEPYERLDRLRAMRERYLQRMPQLDAATARAGWTLLTGDAASVRRVADAVGFAYTYVADRAEWAHPAALIMLGSSGVVTRYVYGIEFAPGVMRESIWKAGLAEPSTAVGFMLRCYHYDPSAYDHSRAGVLALRIGAGAFVVLLVTGFGVLRLTRRARPIRPSHAREGVS